LIEMETLKGFPNPPATLRSRQSRLAPHAILAMTGRTGALRLSVIVVVRDDEDSIGRDVRDLALRLRQRGLDFEILAISDGTHDTSLTLLRFLSAELPELSVLGMARNGRAFRRATAHAQGDVVLLWEANRGGFPHAILGWALSRLARRPAVVGGGRFGLADRMRALPVLLDATGRGEEYEVHFERRAASLGLDLEIVGRRARRGLFAPVLRILAGQGP
jgi:hypothetical protein